VDGPFRSVDRRPLICGVVAAGALLLVWFLPSASTDGDASHDGTSSVLPLDAPQVGFDPDR
jgi:hypothetical protein